MLPLDKKPFAIHAYWVKQNTAFPLERPCVYQPHCRGSFTHRNSCQHKADSVFVIVLLLLLSLFHFALSYSTFSNLILLIGLFLLSFPAFPFSLVMKLGVYGGMEDLGGVLGRERIQSKYTA